MDDLPKGIGPFLLGALLGLVLYLLGLAVTRILGPAALLAVPLLVILVLLIRRHRR